MIPDQTAIWRYFQNEAPQSFAGATTRLKYCVRQVYRRGLRRVLNVGIGAGTFERLAQANGLIVSSLDPDVGAVQHLREQLGVDARQGYIQAMPFDNGCLDAVVVSDVLEHLNDDELVKAIREVVRVLRPGGYLIGTTVCEEDLMQTSVQVVCPYCGKRFHRWGHQQSFTVERLRALLSAYGMTVEKLAPRLFVNFATLNWKGRAVGLCRLILWVFGKYDGRRHIVFIASNEPSCHNRCSRQSLAIAHGSN